MSGFPILDLVVGIIFIYFLLSIICSSAVELWFSILSTRAKMLEIWLKRILDKDALDSNGNPRLEGGKPVSVGQEIMDHCMVTVLSKKGRSTSYIDAKNFVSALLDKITLSPAVPGTNKVLFPPETLKEYTDAIKDSTLISGELKRTILLYANEAKLAAAAIKTIPAAAHITNNITTEIKSEMDHFRDRLENWYDTNSTRLTGTFKRTKVIPRTFILATIITISLNADSVAISKYLYDHKQVSKEFADKAMSSLGNYKERIDRINNNLDTANRDDSAAMARLDSNLNQVKRDVDTMRTLVPQDLPMGWKGTKVTGWNTFWDYFFNWMHIGGWLATILAICMGAPFWFDVLNKIANLRGTGTKPKTEDDK